MANVSYFKGVLILQAENERVPWTPEALMYLYNVLMTMDCRDGSYGFAIDDDDIIENQAAFLDYCLRKDTPPYTFYIWGNGRWSCYSTLESFETWTYNAGSHFNDAASLQRYRSDRQKLLKLMEDNKWSLEIEYVDAEGGVGFIDQGTIILESEFDNDLGCYVFDFNYVGSQDYSYDLHNYSTLMEEHRTGDAFAETAFAYYEAWLEYYIHLEDFNWDDDECIEDYNEFKNFIIDNDYDHQMYPYEYIDSKEDMMEHQEQIINEWHGYRSTLKVEHTFPF